MNDDNMINGPGFQYPLVARMRSEIFHNAADLSLGRNPRQTLLVCSPLQSSAAWNRSVRAGCRKVES